MASGGSMLGPGGTGPPKSCPGPQNFFQDNLGHMVDVIGSIVISLSCCCLPNDEGPGPQMFFSYHRPCTWLYKFFWDKCKI